MIRRISFLVILITSIILISSCSKTQSASIVDRGFLGEITDPSQYYNVMQEIGENPAVNHFPSKVPTDAQNVRFHFHPSVFQGGSVLQLKVELPTSIVEGIYSEYIDQAKVIVSPQEVISIKDEGVELRLPAFYTGGKSTEWPDSYDILFIESTSTGSEDAPWNHGIIYGLSVSSSESVVVYWYEDW